MLPRRAGLLLAIVPVLALVGAPWLANRDEPRVLGMLFLLAWIVAWVVLSSLAMLLLVRFGESDDAAFVPHATPDANADPAPAPSAARMSLERWSVGNRGFGSLLVLMPLYQLILLFVFFIGFTALLSVPALPRAITDINTGLLALACNTAVMLLVSLATQRTVDRAPAAVSYAPVPRSAPAA